MRRQLHFYTVGLSNMSKRLQVSLTVAGPLILLLTCLLDPRVSVVLSFGALIVFSLWAMGETRSFGKRHDLP